MTQHEAVILALEKLGGIATLGQLYSEAFKIRGCKWGTKTPLATIRRIVQTRREIYKIKPGLYGLTSRKAENESKGAVVETQKNKTSKEVTEFNHYYYQGLLLTVGKLKKFDCWCPDQDKNRNFLTRTLGSLRTLPQIPPFSYTELVERSATIDVIWFNQRRMPSSFFEVEQQGEIQNSLLKFSDLQDFHARMVIVADKKHESQYAKKKKYSAFENISERLRFLDYESLVGQYEGAIASSKAEIVL
ncbi:MAG TPA: hypothetical protein VN873_11105 [Candidatus Angelobacter sp.]|nr:hypothetical protein [Candidatus Angelobacter sp.]